MQARKLKASEVIPLRIIIAGRQNHTCPVCQRKFSKSVVGCLDHNHTTGYIRGVLCRACNRLEGQVKNRVAMAGGKDDPEGYIERLAAYWLDHKVPKVRYLHPTYQTEAEKRLARNAKARAKRASLKGK